MLASEIGSSATFAKTNYYMQGDLHADTYPLLLILWASRKVVM
jgi:hypothetical protein